jgi:biopolymer transport protein ExbB
MSNLSPTLIVNGTLYTLAAFSVATWTLILFKAWQLWRSGEQNRRFDAAFWDAPDLADAANLPPRAARGPLWRVARRGFAWLAESRDEQTAAIKYRGRPEELLGRRLRVQMEQEQGRMETGLTVLASIGSTAPFVGLFGTVVGIMHALREVGKAGTASLDVVAGPIGDALIATALGIAVAVPAVLAYNFFLRLARHRHLALENFARDFLHLVLHPQTQSSGD